jgi:hypothetical protein
MTSSVYSPSAGKHIEVKTLDTGVKPSKRRRREADLFIKVPLKLMEMAGKTLTSRAVHVLILLLHMSFEARSLTFACPNGFLDRYGIGRKKKCPALAELEAAGFITIQRKPRCSPIVTLTL